MQKSADRAYPLRLQLGIAKSDPQTQATLDSLFANLEIWLLVTSDKEREVVEREVGGKEGRWPVRVFSLNEISSALHETR